VKKVAFIYALLLKFINKKLLQEKLHDLFDSAAMDSELEDNQD
jgi:hypothetical protein